MLQSTHHPDPHLPRGPAVGAHRDPWPGIRWVRLPLPFELNHINVWLLEGDDGWTLVDTGLDTTVVRDTWRALFDSALEGKPLRRIIVTHYHPDHMGLARFLQEEFEPQMLMTAATAERARFLLEGAAAADIEDIADYCRSHGIDRVEQYTAFVTGAGYRKMVSGLPEPAVTIDGRASLHLGGQEWQPIIANGHAPGHVSLYHPARKLLIAGDQILPVITPNISVTATNRDEDALQEYFDSLRRFAELDPETVVLPAHGPLFNHLQQRIETVTGHHRQRLDRLLSLCTEPLCLAEVTPRLFRRQLQGLDYPLALGEALSHLVYLYNRGELERFDDGGLLRFVGR